MISILRTNTPPLLDSGNRNLLRSDYSKDEVIEALLIMQHSKCCYCEKRLTDLGSTERWVEHIKPQSEFKDANGQIDWNQANAWQNLLYSCATCNRKKGKTPLIDPKSGIHILVEPSHPDIEPENHISFFIDGPLITHIAKNNSPMGKITIEKLFSGRAELYKAFKKIKANIDATFEKIGGAVGNNDKGEFDLLLGQLRVITCSKVIHSNFNRTYLRYRIISFNEDELPIINNHFHTEFPEINVHIACGHECIT